MKQQQTTDNRHRNSVVSSRLLHLGLYIFLSIMLCGIVSADLTDNIVGYYKHDNATISGVTSIDSLGKANGTITGATLFNPGKVNDALDFSGVNQYVTMNPTMTGAVGSVNMWYYADTTNNNQQLFYRVTATGYWGMTYRSGADTVLYRCGGGASIVSDDTAPSGAWTMMTLVCDGTNGLLYFNGTLVHNTTTAHGIDNTQLMYLGVAGAGLGDDYNGKIDEIGIWNTSLTPALVSELYNSSTPPVYPFYAPATGVTPVIDLLFINLTNNTKITFNEGEDFSTFINYTLSNGSVVTNDTARCNVTFVNGLSETDASDDNFTLCLTGCDNITYTEELDLHSTTNAVTDIVHFYGCHEQLSQGDIDVTVECGAVTNTTTISALEMPLCSVGSAFIEVFDASCIASQEVNVSVSASVINNRRKRIVDLAVDRQYSTDTHNASYNATSELWYLNNTHEYYEHGLQTIYANCTNDNISLSINHSETITIVNAPPQIFFSQVFSPGAVVYSLIDNVILEFENGTWTFTGAVVDDDLDTLNVTFYCTNGTSLQSYQGSPNITALDISSDLLADFDCNPFNLSVWVNDSNNRTTNASVLFIMNDTTAPTCDFESSYRWESDNDTLRFNVTCIDEHFYSLNVTCPNNNASFYVDGLNTASYTFSELFEDLTYTEVCYVRYCDGHTANELSKYWDAITYESKIEILANAEIVATIWTLTPGSVVSYDVKDDRISYSFDISSSVLDVKKDYVVFYLNTSADSVYLPSDEYLGWVVIDNQYWFDMNSDSLNEKDKVKVKKVKDGLFEITLKVKDKVIEFKSIGELNCVETVFNIREEMFYALIPGVCPVDDGDALLLFMLFVIAFGLIGFAVWTEWGLIGVLGSIMLLSLSWVVVGCHLISGFIMFGLGIWLLLKFSLDFDSGI